MTDTATRNRNIKKVLTQAFGTGKVAVRGSRGSAYGWVTVDIAYAPRDREELSELTSKVWDLFKTAKIEIGTYGYNDPGSDYGFGSKIHINFERCRDTFAEGERVSYCGKLGVIKDRDFCKGGDWYAVQLDNGELARDCYKKDMVRA